MTKSEEPKSIATYHNGVLFYSKAISLKFPEKIKSYKKRMSNKELVIVEEKEVAGFLHLIFVKNEDQEKYLAKPKQKVKMVLPNLLCKNSKYFF